MDPRLLLVALLNLLFQFRFRDTLFPTLYLS